MLSFDELFTRLRSSDETTDIEAKRSIDGSESAIKTICAFANEPGAGGGYILLGVSVASLPDDEHAYEITGVRNADKVQSDLVNQCNGALNVVIRPEVQVHVTDLGKRVVAVRIPEADPSEKPVYLKKQGLPKGAYRRIGSSDQHCTDDDLALLYHLRGDRSYDGTIVDGASVADLDPAAITEYRRTRLTRSAEELAMENEEMLVAIGAAANSPRGGLVITRAGLLLFGRKAAIRRLMPSARVDYILVAGEDWVLDTSQPLRSTEVREPLMLAIPRIARLVLQDLPTTFQLKGKGLRRKEVPAIPERVIRESLVNALMHRSYRELKPVQIIRFSNRLEIRNPGHSLVADDDLGKPGSKTRNERLADVLHDCGYAETKGTGIGVMRDQMKSANMTEPIFRSDRRSDSFEVKLFTHNLLDAETLKWLGRFTALRLSEQEAKALVVARVTGYIDNSGFRNVNQVDVLSASNSLRRLRDLGLLNTIGRGTATYYEPTELLLHGTIGDKAPLSRMPAMGDKGAALPLDPALVGLLRKIGERTHSAMLVEIAVLRLCAIRPLTTMELSNYLKRSPDHLKKRFIRRMVKEGKLRQTHPDSPVHPKQAYICEPWLIDIEIPADTKSQRRSKRTTEPKLF